MGTVAKSRDDVGGGATPLPHPPWPGDMTESGRVVMASASLSVTQAAR
jgi:hypothetical protein